jgi:hypothetical protein
MSIACVLQQAVRRLGSMQLLHIERLPLAIGGGRRLPGGPFVLPSRRSNRAVVPCDCDSSWVNPRYSGLTRPQSRRTTRGALLHSRSAQRRYALPPPLVAESEVGDGTVVRRASHVA